MSLFKVARDFNDFLKIDLSQKTRSIHKSYIDAHISALLPSYSVTTELALKANYYILYTHRKKVFRFTFN